jgi:hypothetical protein
LKLEELALFALSIWLFGGTRLPWWLYPALLLAPDLGILGYAAGPRVGAITYNLAHFKAVAVVLYAVGISMALPGLALAGLIVLRHSSLDRVLGYGLKYPDAFHHTHLGMIGRG